MIDQNVLVIFMVLICNSLLMEKKIIVFVLKAILWIAGLYASAYYSFHTIYFVVTGFYFMFTNLGKRKEGTLSAYSVFN